MAGRCHASAVTDNCSTVLTFDEKGGAGKTTTALALANLGWQLLANDQMIVRPDDHGQLRVLPAHGRVHPLHVHVVAVRCPSAVAPQPSGQPRRGLYIRDALDQPVRLRSVYGHRLWQFPGGNTDTGEDPLETARRKATEETGLDLGQGRPRRLLRHYLHPGPHWPMGKIAHPSCSS